MSLNELIAQREALARQQAEIAKAIADAQQLARKDVMQQIKTLMAEHGLTAADLSESTRKPRGSLADAPGPSRAKVAAKFRDPDSGQTWSGRGLMPKWLRAAVDAGRAKESFAV